MTGVQNIKERLTIDFNSDMRHANVKFDGWTLPGKLMDLPTIIESLKTLDNKAFYKTADISQILICKDKEDFEDEPEESTRKTKDGKEKRYLFPHGVTKPLKNVRKKRFRKMLKKKNVDMAEIEKEVKRLLRTDNEAKSIRFEIVNEDGAGQSTSGIGDASLGRSDSTSGFVGGDALASLKPGSNMFDDYGAGASTSGAHKKNETIHSTEQDLFGDELSSSDDDNE